MAQIPKDNIDRTIVFLKDGYNFISNKCDQFQSDIFESRLLLQKTLFMKGKDAARIFYDTEHFKREGVVPNMIKATLFGEGGVQGLDDDEHLRRKKMFMDILNRESVETLASFTDKYLAEYAERWKDMNNVALHDEVQELLCKSVTNWAGMPLAQKELLELTRDLAAMIDGAGSVGVRHLKARSARNITEKWLGNVIEKIRTKEIKIDKDSALFLIANHVDDDGNYLNSKIAAVELINLLRPTVAISRYIVFAALALHRYPEYREKLKRDEVSITNFVHEVRRFYPFFPVVAAEVRKSFTWNGYHFPVGRRVILDIYGTNHDSRIWKNPEQFQPERFSGGEPGEFDLIPQGGGSFHTNHRCAGEWTTITLMKIAVNFLINSIEYEVPDQNLDINFSRIPTLPESGFIINNVH